jgi:hypothetical protein
MRTINQLIAINLFHVSLQQCEVEYLAEQIRQIFLNPPKPFDLTLPPWVTQNSRPWSITLLWLQPHFKTHFLQISSILNNYFPSYQLLDG